MLPFCIANKQWSLINYGSLTIEEHGDIYIVRNTEQIEYGKTF